MASIELIAHRGNAAEFPENTLPALRSALELGLRHLAIGVQLTRDCEPVVLHDHDLRRTSEREGSVLDLSITEAVAVEVAERQTGLPVTDPVRFGADVLVRAIRRFLSI